MMAGVSLWTAMLLMASSTPVPDGARRATLDEELTINAIPTHVREWTLDLSMEDSKSFYRRYLGEQRIELARGHGLLLAAPVGEGFTTVELLPDPMGRTRARVSEARLISGEPPQIQAPIPLPPYTHILSSVGGGSGSDASQTLVARTNSGLEATAAFFERTLARQGLRMMQRRPLQQGPKASEALSFAGAEQHMDLVLTVDAGHTWIAAMLRGRTP
jgi:hypothetical protein